MVDRTDPARTGVKAGRVVGVLTAALAVTSLIRVQGSYYEAVTTVFRLLGIAPRGSVAALFWGTVFLTAATRYVLGYVVGSLVGVLCDWLDRTSPPVLVALVLPVGVVDGGLAAVDTGSIVIGCAYTIAWLCYVPVFLWIFDEDPGDTRAEPLRLGNS